MELVCFAGLWRESGGEGLCCRRNRGCDSFLLPHSSGCRESETHQFHRQTHLSVSAGVRAFLEASCWHALYT